jgi:TRAP-type C4-dicarboxylate transport system substrate-binding protein
MMRSLTLAAVMAMGLSAPALAQTTWQMPTPYPESSVVTRNVIQFAKEVHEATDGKLNIVVHPAASLIKHGEIKNAVRSGQVEIGEILASTLSNDDPVYEMDSLPFLVSNFDDAHKLWEVVRDHVQGDMNRQRMTVLFANSWGPQGLYSLGQVEDISAMRGARFRAYNYTTERIAQLAGAVPTQVEAADLAQAFSTGRATIIMTCASRFRTTSSSSTTARWRLWSRMSARRCWRWRRAPSCAVGRWPRKTTRKGCRRSPTTGSRWRKVPGNCAPACRRSATR